MPSWKELNHHDLHAFARGAAEAESKATLTLMDLLAEADQRKLHVVMGYSNLRNYAIFELGISETRARDLIDATRLMNILPEVREDFERKQLSLSTVAKLSRYLRREHADENQALLLLDQLKGKSPRMVDQILADHAKNIVKKEMVRPLGLDTTRIVLDVDQHFMNLVSKARETKGVQNIGLRDLFKLALEDCNPPAPQPSPSTSVRTIPVPVMIQLGGIEKPKKTLLN